MESIIDYSKFKLGEKIASCKYNSVYKIECKETKKIFIAKFFSKSINQGNLSRDINIITKLQHPTLLKTIGYSYVNNKGSDFSPIISEYYPNTLDLVFELEKKGIPIPGWNDTKKFILIYGIAAGMQFLHSRKILHGDLKPSNILLDEHLCPKIADFGLLNILLGENTMKMCYLNKGVTENPVYLAPEVLNAKKFTTKSDVYSFSMLMYEIISSQHLHNFSIRKINLKTVKNGYRPEFNFPIVNSYRNLIESCWSEDPSKRPTFKQICLNIFETLRNDKEARKDFVYYANFITNYLNAIKDKKPIPTINLKSPNFQKVDLTELLNKSNNDNQIEVKSSDQPSESQKNQIHNNERKPAVRKPIASKPKAPNDKEKAIKHNDNDDDDNERQKKPSIGLIEDEKNHEVISKISEGESSEVFKVIDKGTGELLCKKIFKEFNADENSIEKIVAISEIDHPCICKEIGYSMQENQSQRDGFNVNDQLKTTVSLFYEFLPYNVEEVMRKGMLNNTLKVRIAVEVAIGMSHIHSLGIIHRNLNLSNIMMNHFFESKIIGLIHSNDFSTEVGNQLKKGITTVAYMSPELVNEEEYDNKTDVYSFGILLYHLFTGSLPNQAFRDKLNYVPINYPQQSDNISNCCISIIKSCTSSQPSNRPSFEKIIEYFLSNSFALAPEIDVKAITQRYNELIQTNENSISEIEKKLEEERKKHSVTLDLLNVEKQKNIKFLRIIQKDRNDHSNVIKQLEEEKNKNNELSLQLNAEKQKNAILFKQLEEEKKKHSETKKSLIKLDVSLRNNKEKSDNQFNQIKTLEDQNSNLKELMRIFKGEFELYRKEAEKNKEENEKFFINFSKEKELIIKLTSEKKLLNASCKAREHTINQLKEEIENIKNEKITLNNTNLKLKIENENLSKKCKDLMVLNKQMDQKNEQLLNNFKVAQKESLLPNNDPVEEDEEVDYENYCSISKLESLEEMMTRLIDLNESIPKNDSDVQVFIQILQQQMTEILHQFYRIFVQFDVIGIPDSFDEFLRNFSKNISNQTELIRSYVDECLKQIKHKDQ
ncbi:hypothetical protein M9Y10_015601 [Tritrichomonas musculus]|uniref:Protein kinase domain-containing protein n=1 Tax=Tritrichomonas musculus TaxID=1915356 RepID=A0ABR2L2Q5_9EUKA